MTKGLTRQRRSKLFAGAALLLAPLFCSLHVCAAEKAETLDDLPLSRLKLPEGFKISLFARLPGARSLTLGDKGTVFVGTRGDKVYALTDQNKDGKADKVYTVASGLSDPNGVAFKDGSLYVAQVSEIKRFDGIESSLASPPRPKTLSVRFPTETHHGWKFIAFGPDGKLYVPVGAPCNVCDRGAPYATILRMNADGSGKELFAKGVRNTVGFDWHPVTKALYFTDNGRDMLGDDVPPDELNAAPRAGLDFGFPRCHAGRIRDPQFGQAQNACAGTEKPVAELGPHVAALGMRFYTGGQFPAAYKHQIFIAEHGSWNRSTPIGYRVTLAKLRQDGTASYETFASGWLGQNGAAWGRPVDVLVDKDGSLLVSDDTAGAVYRISYGP